MTTKQRERAVAIAKDALRIIKLKGVEVRANFGYVKAGVVWDEEADEDVSMFRRVSKEGDNFQKVLKEVLTSKAPCRVCALGGLFLAHVDLYNKVKINKDVLRCGGFDRKELVEHLGKTFSKEQMDLIEECFENPFYCELYLDPNPTERLKAILKNIIANDGEFVLSEAT